MFLTFYQGVIEFREYYNIIVVFQYETIYYSNTYLHLNPPAI